MLTFFEKLSFKDKTKVWVYVSKTILTKRIWLLNKLDATLRIRKTYTINHFVYLIAISHVGSV